MYDLCKNNLIDQISAFFKLYFLENSPFKFDLDLRVGQEEKVSRQKVQLSLRSINNLVVGQQLGHCNLDLRHCKPHSNTLTRTSTKWYKSKLWSV